MLSAAVLAIAARVGVSKWVVVGAALFITFVALGGTALAVRTIWNAGYAAADAKWQAEIAREKERLRKENEAALSESRRRIAELNALLAKLEEELRNADEESRLDPSAGRVCLGTDSVRRLNRIH